MPHEHYQVDAVFELMDLVLEESADVLSVEVACQTSGTSEVEVHDPAKHLLCRGSLTDQIDKW